MTGAVGTFSDTPIAERPEPPLVRDPEDRKRVLAFLEAKLGVARKRRSNAAGPVTCGRARERLDVLLEVYAPLLIGRHAPPADPPGGETPPSSETD